MENPVKTVAGVVKFIVYASPDSDFKIVRLQPDDTYPDAQDPDGTIAIVGVMPPVQPGDSVVCHGDWEDNARYGLQFRVSQLDVLAEQRQISLFTPQERPDDDLECITGTVERVTYHNEESGWSVIKIMPDQDYPLATARDGTMPVVGVMPDMVAGERAQFEGRWVDDPRYGRQLRSETVTPMAPDSKQGVISYLADTVFGVGPVTAERIYDYFGDETIVILDQDPERIHDVPGLKTTLAENVIQAWAENRKMRQVMIHLQNYGITSTMARRIYNHYEDMSIQIIEDDPYQLADDVHGIGFKRADQIALNMKLAPDSPQRLRAGLHYTLRQLAKEGHTFAPADFLLLTTLDILNLETEDTASSEADDLFDIHEDDVDVTEDAEDLDPLSEELTRILNNEITSNRLFSQTLYINESEAVQAVYLPIYYRSETGAALRLRQLREAPSKIMFRMNSIDPEAFLEDLADMNNVALSKQQQSAVIAAMTDKISILTGGPGTGKTTTVQMIIHALEEEGFKYLLASPTGRAAKRLAETTEREAQTIHRMLGWQQTGGFDHDEDNPLKADMVIVDESSMLDLVLFYNLLKALPVSAHLLLVGDVDQLPSVGAGNVLRDVINSGIGTVTRLQQIFRQDSKSYIITNAHRINNGQMPQTDNRSSDFFFFRMDEPAAAAEMVVDIVRNRLPQKFGYTSLDDIQVIAPMYRGAIGVNALNVALQASLNNNPDMAEKRLGGTIFRVGDKVMQTKNNYDKEVFNGDIGRLIAIDFEEKLFHTVIDDRVVEHDFTEAGEQLIHAYCISTHRSQGSEYPVVVMPLMTQHYIMLQRNLLYTAITRARKMVVLVGNRKAISIAVNNNRVAERYSGLLPRLL